MRKVIESLGFQLQSEGNGLNHMFQDGEKVVSQYEYQFSNYLRDRLKLKYQKDFIRDVRYKTFINDYNGLMDCDYIITYKGIKYYIEIAGMLRDYRYDNYKEKEIKSKSKSNYRNKLIQKEEMLKKICDTELNSKYYIIFPHDCNEEFFNGIFEVSSQSKNT